MAPEELLISESQERMVLIVKSRDEAKLRSILDKWEVSYAKIGRVTSDGILIIRRAGEIVAKAPAKFVAEAPLEPHADRKPSYLDELAGLPDPPEPRDLKKTLVDLLSDPNIASKEWIYRQYDHEVGLRTIVRPGDADASVLRLPNGRTLSATSDGNSKECYLDPYWGTVGVLSEACSNLIATAAEPVAVVDHLQFGNPNNPEVYWTFKETVRAVAEYLKASKLPCIGGKVSFYNQDETTGKAIKPTPVIAAIGLRERKTPWISQGLQRNGDDLIIVGNTLPELGGSEYYEHVHKHTGGRVPRVNMKTERLLQRTLLSALRTGKITGAHDISKGGLAVALAEMAVKGERGFTVDTEMVPRKTTRADHLLFSESPGRFIFEVKPRSTPNILARFKRSKIPVAKIGKVEGSEMEFQNRKEELISLPLAEARDAWSNTIPRIMEGAA